MPIETTLQTWPISEVLQVTPVRMVLSGGSLSPLIPDGSVVSFERVDFRRLRVGHIVVYYGPDCLICHQVVRRAADHVSTRGFCHPTLDPAMTEDGVLGRVTRARLPDGTLLNLDTNWFVAGSWLLAMCGLGLVLACRGRNVLGGPKPEGAAGEYDLLERTLLFVFRAMARLLRALASRARSDSQGDAMESRPASTC